MGAPTATLSNTTEDDGMTKPASHHDRGLEDRGSLTTAATTSVTDDEGLQPYLSLIQQYLAVFMVDNATFLADRCVAEYPTHEQAVYLQALCYYRAHKPQTARLILERFRPKHSASPMHYLAAQCSYELKDYTRAEDALLRETRTNYRQQTLRGETGPALSMEEWVLQTTPCPVPNGAAGLALLGNIYRRSNRKERAIQYFHMSLQLDPFLWTSFEALAELGHPVEPTHVFGVVPTHHSAPAAAGIVTATIHENMYQSLSQQPLSKIPLQPLQGSLASTPALATAVRSQPPSRATLESPGLTPIAPSNNTTVLATPHSAIPLPQRQQQYQHDTVVRRARQVASRQYYPPSPETPVSTVTRSMRYLHGLSGMDTTMGSHQSSSLRSGTKARSLFTTSENHASSNRSAFHPSLSIAESRQQGQLSEHDTSHSLLLQKPVSSTDDKVQPILELLSITGTAYQALCRYQCSEALEALRRLPRQQQMTAWALHQQGRAYLELNDFVQAQRCLEMMHKLEPGRMKGLELLSTVYWQLRKEVELASLAQRVVDWDRFAPEAWCVVGNCFSLQKDHESALVFFKRSLQLDPDFTYTHTLCGYEYMANDDFEKAMSCFRQALRTNDRHYNAWYGMGGIYQRQEKFDLAEYHFERACSIHPTSSILRCNLGIAEYANGKAYQALETLSEASRLDPRNPQARFQKATIFSALHRPTDALQELEKVRDAAPREATVYFAMGKVLKRLGRVDDAMKCFLCAMDLDPKDSQMIKSAMDKLDDPEIDEESMAPF